MAVAGPKRDKCVLSLRYLKKQPAFLQLRVSVPSGVVNSLYRLGALAQCNIIQTKGFNQGTIPIDYIQQHYKSSILNHIQEFLLKFCVGNFLFRKIREEKIMSVGDPRLIDIFVAPNEDAYFDFEVSLFQPLLFHEWRYFPFRCPKRKNYKDLDRQVESFIKEEKKQQKELNNNTIGIGDWVHFRVALADQNEKLVFGPHYEDFWYKVGDEEADGPLRDVFLEKKIGDSFYTQSGGLQEFFSEQFKTNYNFHICICDFVPNSYFSFEHFKKHFRIKTNKEMSQKLIEVFSYRNDLSQRRSMAEESLKLLLTKHKFDVPSHLVLRQQKVVLDAVHENPDYHVYRVQKDFNDRVRQLAEKQTKETILIDQLAFSENMAITHADVATYLNLMQRPRTKEFIYFDPPSTKILGQEMPLFDEEIKQICLREKTLNHVIYHLTKA